jgi:hypothetical protein
MKRFIFELTSLKIVIMSNTSYLPVFILAILIQTCDWEPAVPLKPGYFAYLHDATDSRKAYSHNDSTCFDWLADLPLDREGAWTLDLFDVSEPLPDPFRQTLNRIGPPPGSWNADFKMQMNKWKEKKMQNTRSLKAFAKQANDLHRQRKPPEEWTYLSRHLHRIWSRLMDPDLAPRILYINSDLLNEEPQHSRSFLSSGMIDSLNLAIASGAHILIYTEVEYHLTPYSELNAHYLDFMEDLQPELQKILSTPK